MDFKLLKSFINTRIQGWTSKKFIYYLVKLVCYFHHLNPLTQE